MSVVLQFLEHWLEMFGAISFALLVVVGGAFLGVSAVDRLASKPMYVTIPLVIGAASLLVTTIVTLVSWF